MILLSPLTQTRTHTRTRTHIHTHSGHMALERQVTPTNDDHQVASHFDNPMINEKPITASYEGSHAKTNTD